MNNNSWLVIAHISDRIELGEFNKTFKKVKKNVSETTDVYVISIYRTKGTIMRITNKSQMIIKIFYQKDDSQKKWCKKMVQFVLKLCKPIAMTYYGHGGAVVVGPWNKPWMGLKAFNEIFIKTVKPEIMAFDSCYLGSIVTLYEIEQNVKLVLASPAWHPGSSISELKLFGALPKYTSATKKAVLAKYAIALSCEFSTIKRLPKYSCLVAFDLTNLDKIVKKIDHLELIDDNNLKLRDPNTYDLLASVNPKVSKQLSTIVLSKRCMSRCPLTIKGASVSYHDKHDVWNKHFKETKWGKFTRTIDITHISK